MAGLDRSLLSHIHLNLATAHFHLSKISSKSDSLGKAEASLRLLYVEDLSEEERAKLNLLSYKIMKAEGRESEAMFSLIQYFQNGQSRSDPNIELFFKEVQSYVKNSKNQARFILFQKLKESGGSDIVGQYLQIAIEKESSLGGSPEYLKELLDLGFEDARTHHNELKDFFEQ